MRVLFMCIPGRGRLEVLSPLAAALQSAGHDVRFAAPASFLPLVTEAGFPGMAAGLDVPAMQELLRRRGHVADGSNTSERAVSMFTEIYPAFVMEELRPQVTGWPPQLIVHEEGEFAGPLLAALIGVRCVTVGWPVAMKPLAVLDRVTAAMTPLWQRMGLDMPRWAGLYRHFVDTCPPTLQSEAATAMADAIPMQPVTAPFHGQLSPADLGIDDSGRPVVHITLGTVDSYNNAPDLLKTVLSGLRDAPIQVILTTGRALSGFDSHEFGNVTQREFLPHRLLLPHCAAVICHGGAGSTIAALAHGLPLLIIPRGGASQHRNALHGARVGVAIHLAEGDVTPAAVQAGVRSLLTEPAFRTNAQRLRQEIDGMPSPGACVASLEQLALAA